MLRIAEKGRDETGESMITLALQRELFLHRGKWVAITKTRLVGLGDSSEEAFEAARQRGEARPMLYRVPPDDDTTYFF
jgi:hypothetical protein